jgi:hypothetical protein
LALIRFDRDNVHWFGLSTSPRGISPWYILRGQVRQPRKRKHDHDSDDGNNYPFHRLFVFG